MKSQHLSMFRGQKGFFASDCRMFCLEFEFNPDIPKLSAEYKRLALRKSSSVAKAVLMAGEAPNEVVVVIPITSGVQIERAVEQVKGILQDFESEVLRVLRDKEIEALVATDDDEQA